MEIAKIADIRPIIFHLSVLSLKTINPIIEEHSTTDTFVIVKTVESFHPVVL